ncbi:nitrate- and nitrite sensing domain-containing protein [Gandjariella thermophila]|uniref:nitrate- and nitrite sensing domain-containing protein n=1 Tax=Gandjariella thermophila TaxID=1931992 RepID=UPI00186404F0|nr:nitrate- and nitrite sensing domain-containing protein [Gandjariella thermophila]
MISAVQQERTLAASRLSDGNAAINTAIQQQGRSVDTAEAAMRDAAAKTPNLGETATGRYQDALRLLGGLPALRQQVLSGSTDAVTAVANYSTVTKGLLDFGQALSSQLGDPALSGTASALQDLLIAQDEVHLQHAIVLAGILRGHLLGTELRTLQESDVRLQDKTADFLALATPAQQGLYQQSVAGSDVNLRKQFEQLALSRATGTSDRPTSGRGQNADTSLPIPVEDWNRSSDTTSALMAKVSGSLADELGRTAASLQDQTSTRAGAASVLLMSTLVVAAAIGFVIGRYLLRSLNVLRRTALEVAENRLPEIVAKVHEGDTEDMMLEPMPLDTTEEFGQLARAFDAVLNQAVRSTVEQAGLRSNLRNIFVNFSRRSQSLVERQLRLMEQLEQHEEDPDQLANLFKLDHLATRMRRNNENLMVLSGSELARRFSKPVPMGDVLRAAVSEIEHYERAVVQSEANAEVVGYAAGDLVRLLAELLDNATNFSPPDSQVTLGSREQRDGSVLIDVLDQGIGMSEAELEDANKRVSAEGGGEVPVSRQMGLFVVGRLASRHGFSVRLFSDEDLGGLRAFVLVPAELVRTKERRGPADFGGTLGGFTPAELTTPPATAANGSGVGQLLANPNAADQGTPGAPAGPGGLPRRSAAADAFGGAGRAQQGAAWDGGPPTQPADALQGFGGQPAEPAPGFGTEPSRPGETSRPGFEPLRPGETSRPGMDPAGPGTERHALEPRRPASGPAAGAVPPLPPAISPAADLFTPTGSEPPRGDAEDGSLRVPGQSGPPAEPPQPTAPLFGGNGVNGASSLDSGVNGSAQDWFAPTQPADAGSGSGSEDPLLGTPSWSSGDESTWAAETAQHPVIPAEPEPEPYSPTPAFSDTVRPAEQAGVDAANGFAEYGAPGSGFQDYAPPADDGAFSWFDPTPEASGSERPAASAPREDAPAAETSRPAGSSRPAEPSRPGIDLPAAPPSPAETSAPPPASPPPAVPERPEPAAAKAEAVDVTSAGLPRRKPKAHLLPSLAQRPSNTAPESTPSHRNPERTRGFLSNYQAGVRQGRPSALQENDNPYGQENP